MLVLSRRLHEKIQFPGLNITVQVVAIRPGVVRIGIEAPSDVGVFREEVLQAGKLLGAYSEEAATSENGKSEEQLLEDLRTLCARLSRLEKPEALRRQAEEICHWTEDRLQTLMGRGSAALLMLDLVDSSADAIISKTLEGVIVSWNGSAERLYGYTAEEVKGRSISLLYPDDGGEELAGIMRTVNRGERIDAHDAVRVRKGGGDIDVSVSHSPIMDANGRLVGASAIAHDVSARKRLERGLQQRAEQLRLAGAGRR